MKITFVVRGQESLAVEYLSAILKNSGYDTELVFDPGLFDPFLNRHSTLASFFSHRDYIIDKIVNSAPDLVAFSVFSDIYSWACEIAFSLKQKIQTPIIFGGIHPTAVPEIVIKNDFVDYVCVGEGEEALVELVESLEENKDISTIKNVFAKNKGVIQKNSLRPLIANLDALPFPDKELFLKEYKDFITNTYWCITGRGCPCRCTFCYMSSLKNIYKEQKVYLRRRSVDNVIAELILAKEKYKIKNVIFFDSIFTYDLGWLREFCHKYGKNINLPFICDVHAQYITEEVVSLLDMSGCALVNLGVQTAGEKLRKEILNRQETNQQIIQAFKFFDKTPITLYAHLIFNLPGQEAEDFLSTARFLNRNKPEAIYPFWLQYYPRTEIVKIAQKKKLLSEEDIRNLEEKNDCLPVASKSSKDVKNFVRLISESLNFPVFLFDWILDRKYYKKKYILLFIYLLIQPYSLSRKIHKKFFIKKRKFYYINTIFQGKFVLYYLLKLYKFKQRSSGR